jgi:hypothetical protein
MKQLLEQLVWLMDLKESFELRYWLIDTMFVNVLHLKRKCVVIAATGPKLSVVADGEVDSQVKDWVGRRVHKNWVEQPSAVP